MRQTLVTWLSGLIRPTPSRAARRRRRSLTPSLQIRRLEERRVLSVDVVDGQSLTIAENSKADTVVGTVAAANDPPAEPLTYSITAGNDSNAFLINPVSGEIRVADGSLLDFETHPTWELTVEAHANGDPTQRDSSVVTISLTDVSGPATANFTGNATLGASGNQLTLTSGGATLWTAGREDVTSLTILGSSAADHLVIDFTGGNPIPAGGIHYDGLDQPGGTVDSLELVGTFDHADYRYDDGHNGGIVVTQGVATGAIEYRNLEPLVNTGSAANIVFTLGAAADHVVLEEVTPGTLRLRSTDAVPTFETTTFTAPTTSLTLRTGDGNDTITVSPLTGSFSLTIDGEGDSNTLIVDQADAAVAAPTFTFAGFEFLQTASPDHAEALSGALDGGRGVVVTSPTGSLLSITGFPESTAGFDPALSLGRLLNPAIVAGTLGVNLPSSNVGTAVRSGVVVSWTGGQTLSDQAGDDFVIYESSSSTDGPDAAMVQVHIAGAGGGWTKWRYETADSRAPYGGVGTAGAFATAFDLADFGLTAGQSIDQIRYVNMTAADRMEGPGYERVTGDGVLVASGFVIPDDNGLTSNVLPDPGSFASFAYFGNATFDPDPLYFGALHPLATSGNSHNSDVIAVTTSTISTTRNGTAAPLINYSSISELDVNTRGGVDSVTIDVAAGLPATIRVDGGSPTSQDSLMVRGTTGAQSFALSGDAITTSATTIRVAGIESTTIDISMAGSGDTVAVDRSFALSGNAPKLQIVGGGTTDNDQLSVDTEYPTSSPAAAQNFTFGGVKFNQSSTPNQLSELGIGTLDGGYGAVITTRPLNSGSTPTFVPSPDVVTDVFNPSLSLGALWDHASATTPRYVSLPDGSNNGTGARGGIAISWDKGRSLTNVAGADFVIYESGDAGADAFMVQVHDADTGVWSQWVYHKASAPTAGVYATSFDLAADFGVAGSVDAIRIANLTAADRVVNASGEGTVVVGGGPGTFAPLDSTNTPFGAGGFDPDLLYFGVVPSLGNVTSRNDVVNVDANSVDVDGFMAVNYAGLKGLTVDTGGGADSIRATPSTDTAYTIQGDTPGISVNPGDRLVLDLSGVTAPVFTSTGIGAGTLASGNRAGISVTGIDSLGATAQMNVVVSEAANSVAGNTDAFNVSRNGASDEISVNGQLVLRVDREAVANLRVSGSDAADDQLTIDYSGGTPVPAGNITFAAGSGGTDLLRTTGGTVTTVTQTYANLTDGNTAIDADLVNYTGLESITDDLTATNRNFVYLATNNAINLGDDVSAAGRSQIVGDHGATTRFQNPTSALSLDAGPGDDVITLARLDTAFSASVTIRGGAGNDDIALDDNGRATVGGTVDWIKFPLAIDGGGQDEDRLTIDDTGSTRDKTYSVSNVQIGGAGVPAGAAVAVPGVVPNVNGTIDGTEWDQVPVAFDSGARPASGSQSILHFNFAANGGNTTADSTGNNNTGVLVEPPGPQFRVSQGRFGGALDFDGVDDFAWFQDAAFDVGARGTLSFWVQMDNVSGRNQFFEGPGNAGLEFQYRPDTGGQFYGRTTDIGGDAVIRAGGDASALGIWTNIQYVWDFSGLPGDTTAKMRIYVNGVESAYRAGTTPTDLTWAAVVNTVNGMMNVGRDPGDAARMFDGRMDDVAWFNSVLTAAERNAIRTVGVEVAQADTAGANASGRLNATAVAGGKLVAYWNLDDAPGTTNVAGDGGTSIVLHTTPPLAQFVAGGKFGGALDFDGLDSYATFQDPTFNVGERGTLSFWVQMDNVGRRNQFFEGPGNSGMEFQYRNSGNGQFYGRTQDNGDFVIRSGPDNGVAGVWTNIQYVWDFSGLPGDTSAKMRIYVNGVESSYLSNANPANSFTPQDLNWTAITNTVNGVMNVGRDPGDVTRAFDGRMDDIAWFNTVLTAAERNAIRAVGVEAAQGDTAGANASGRLNATAVAGGNLIAYWNLNDAPGTKIVPGDGGTSIVLKIGPQTEGAEFIAAGGPTLPSGGAPLNAVYFDGNKDFIRTSDSASLDFNKSQGSISFWVRPDQLTVDNSAANGYIALAEDSSQQIFVGISRQQDAGAAFGNADFFGRIVFSPFENTPASNQNIVVSNTRLTVGQWTQVTVTWDYATLSASIYINGALDSTVVNKTSNPAIWTQAAGNTGDWLFGADGKTQGHGLLGAMADIAVYGNTLRASEVQSLYQTGATDSGSFDLAGARGRFSWDANYVYGLIESYPAGPGTANGPFDNLELDLYINNGATLAARLDASVLVPVNNIAGSTVAPSGSDVQLYEFRIPISAINDGVKAFDPASGDFLRYHLRTIDGEVAGSGFDTRDTTLGWIVEPPITSDNLRRMDFAKSENFFGVGGRLNYTNFAHLTLNAGSGIDALTVVDSQIAPAATNPTRTFTLNTGGGADVVTIDSVDSAFRAAVSIDGEAGTDVVTINAPLALGSALSTGNLTVTAETIAMNAAVDTTAGTVGNVTFHVGGTLTIADTANITAGGDVLIDGTGATSTAGDITTFGDKITVATPATLTGDVTLTTSNGNVLFSGASPSVKGDYLLTIDAGNGDVTFNGAVGVHAAPTHLSGIDVTAGSLWFKSTVDVDDQGIDIDVTGTVRFDGAVTTTAGGTMTVTNGGILTINDAANLDLDGAFTQDGVGATDLFANITTTNDNIAFHAPLRLQDDVTFTTAGGDVGFQGATATINGTHQLNVNAFGGDVLFDGAIGAVAGGTRVGGILITSSGNVDFAAPASLASGGLDITASGAVNFNAAVDTTSGGTATIKNGGLLTIVDAADFTLDGAFAQTGVGQTSLAGDISTTNDAVSFNAGVTIATNAAGAVVIDTGTTGGNVTFNSTLDSTTAGIEDLRLNAIGHDVVFNGLVGGVKALGEITIDAARNLSINTGLTAVSLANAAGTGQTSFSGATHFTQDTSGTALTLNTPTIVSTASVTSDGGTFFITTDNLSIGAAFSVTSDGEINVVERTAGRDLELGGNTAGRLALDAAELAFITAKTLRIGDNLAGDLHLSAPVSVVPGVMNLHLMTGGGVSGAGAITATNLAVEAFGDVRLDNANDVVLLAIHTGVGNDISYRDTNDFRLDDVDGVGGIEAPTGNVTLETPTLMTQGFFGSIVAGGLQLLGGSAQLGLMTNDVDILSADLDGALNFGDTDDLEVGTVQTFGPATSGITTTNDAVYLASGQNLSLNDSIVVGAAQVNLRSDFGAIDSIGAASVKIEASILGLWAAQGIGVTQALKTDVATLAASNALFSPPKTSGIRIDDVSGGLLTLGTVTDPVLGPFFDTSGLFNLGLGGTVLTHVGELIVNQLVYDAGGGITLSTTANGGNDDNLIVNAPVILGSDGNGDITFTAGTDLLVNNTGVFDDVRNFGAGSIVGAAGRDVVLGPDVRIRSLTGAIVGIPPLLENVSAPQIANTGDGSVTFDFGRNDEFHFTVVVDWADGVVDTIELNQPARATATAFHTYTGNPNTVDPAAPIPVTLVLRSDALIRFTGYETTTSQILLTFPGDGVKNVRIDTTIKVRHLTAEPPQRITATSQQSAPVQIQSNVYNSGGAALQSSETAARVVILREVLPDGREGSAVRFPQTALDDLPALFKKLRNGRYRVYLFEPETQTLRTVLEVDVREGKPAVPAAGGDTEADPADGAYVSPPAGDDFDSDPPGGSQSADAAQQSTSHAAALSAATAGIGLALAASDESWSRRVDAALSQFRKFSRLRPLPTPRRKLPR
ncbi:MAG: hypothetical protein C0483_19115 [Pirellula sp.]|nr:hypothetical protein [Pirellula sp.]